MWRSQGNCSDQERVDAPMGSNCSGEVAISHKIIILCHQPILCHRPRCFLFDVSLIASQPHSHKIIILCNKPRYLVFSLMSLLLPHSWLSAAYLHRQDSGLHNEDLFSLLSLTRSRSQDGYCEYMADGTKALLLKKIFSEAEKVMKCSMDKMMMVAMNVPLKCHL